MVVVCTRIEVGVFITSSLTREMQEYLVYSNLNLAYDSAANLQQLTMQKQANCIKRF